MKNLSPEDQAKFIVIVNRYFTPFAILLVGFGIALSQPKPWLMWTSLGLVAFSTAFNLGTASFAASAGGMGKVVASLRLYTNLAINCVLVYLLGGYWTPIWLLFVLTPAATAVYGSRRKTLATALGVSALLLLSHGLRKFNAPVDWGGAWVEALFILFLSLFLNELSELTRGKAEIS